MRSILTRYVFFELLKVFLVTLAGMSLLVILVLGGTEAVRQGLGPLEILKLIPFILPDSLRFSVPATILFAACSVYGRVSGANEVVAVKSMGISPMVLMWPALILGFLLSLVSVWLNDVAVSWGAQGVQNVIVSSFDKIAYGMLRTQGAYSTDHFSINVRDVDGRRLINPTVIMQGDKGESPTTLTAQEAELKLDDEYNSIILQLYNHVIEIQGKATHVVPGSAEYILPLGNVSRKGDVSRGPSHCPLWRIPQEIIQQQQQIDHLEQDLAARTAYQIISGDFQSLAGLDTESKKRELKSHYYRLYRLKTEPWRRWANGFSCFFFVLVSAPLAIRLRNSDFTTSFILCFLPILIVYYPLLLYGVDRSKSGAVPPYMVWLGNLICLIAGALLIRRVIRY